MTGSVRQVWDGSVLHPCGCGGYAPCVRQPSPLPSHGKCPNTKVLGTNPPPLPTTPRNSSHRLLFLPLLGRSQGDSFTCTCECECGRERLGMHGCRRARVSVDMRVQECTCGHSLSVSSPGHPPPSSQGAHPLPPAHRAAWWQNWPWSSSPRHPDLSRGTSVAVLFCMFAGTSSCSPHSPPGQERDALVSTL